MSNDEMLSELAEMGSDKSTEKLWETRITITTRDQDKVQGTITERSYTFDYAQEFDSWYFSEYEELETEDTLLISRRDWRVVERIYWEDNEEATVDVPTPVWNELSTRLSAEVQTFR